MIKLQKQKTNREFETAWLINSTVELNSNMAVVEQIC